MFNFDGGLKENSMLYRTLLLGMKSDLLVLVNKRALESKLDRRATYRPGGKGGRDPYPGINNKRMSIE